jgi:PPOX class probable F420-dependent enzyme
MSLTFDTSTEVGKRAVRLLETSTIAWLTTVDGDGRPFPSPVWFLYEDDGTLLIYSQPDKPKLRNIGSNAAVAINFDSEENGDRVVIFEGAAVIDDAAKAVTEHAAYLAKYHEGILGIDMTDESFSKEFSVAVRVVLQKLRGW